MTSTDKIVQAAERGLTELVVRVSRFEDDMRTPAAWQAIAKFRGRESGPWGVGIRANPAAAIAAALDAHSKPPAPEEDIFS